MTKQIKVTIEYILNEDHVPVSVEEVQEKLRHHRLEDLTSDIGKCVGLEVLTPDFVELRSL